MAARMIAQDDNGPFVERLHALQAAHQAGEISILEFDAAYRALDLAAGVPCACGRGRVDIRPVDGGPARCAACWREAALAQ